MPSALLRVSPVVVQPTERAAFTIEVSTPVATGTRVIDHDGAARAANAALDRGAAPSVTLEDPETKAAPCG